MLAKHTGGETKPFTTAATVDGVSPLKDGGLSVRFHTQEMNTEDKVKLMGYYQNFGWLLFSPEPLSEKDIPEQEIDPYDRKASKSPSQRLRAVLYLLWKQSGSQGDSEDHYRKELEKIISHYQNKLE